MKDEAFVLGLYECESPRNARQDGSDATSNNLLQRLGQRDLFLIERGVFGDSENNFRSMQLIEFSGDVVSEEPATRDRKTVLRVKILEVGELRRELITQTRIGDDLPVAIALVALHKRCN